jgi:hybrid cluster-associated redox disulfide protein
MSLRINITKDTIIADILREYPECVEVFNKHNMLCQTCMGASTGTVEEGAIMHGVDQDLIIAELIECCKRAEGNSTAGEGS